MKAVQVNDLTCILLGLLGVIIVISDARSGSVRIVGGKIEMQKNPVIFWICESFTLIVSLFMLTLGIGLLG